MKAFFCILFLMPLFALSQSNFDKAAHLFRQGKLAQSQAIFESYLQENPNDIKTLEFLGDIHGSAKNWDKALFYYEKLKKLKPAEANYYYKYGGVLGMIAKGSNRFKALGMVGEVKGAFEKAIALNPRHIDARKALIEVYIQLPGIVGGSERKANHYAEELLAISPVEGFMAKGRIETFFKRYAAAEIQYKKAIAVSDTKAPYQALSDLYKNKMNQPEKAKRILADFDKSKD